MVADTECGEDFDKRHEHAGRAERRESCECGCGTHVAGEERRVREDCEEERPERARIVLNGLFAYEYYERVLI